MSADGGGIIQEIELALETTSAQRLRDAIQSALHDGTNPAAAVSNLDKVEGKLGSLGTAAKEVRKIFAEFGLILGLAEVVKQIVSANIEFEHLSAQLVSFTGSAAKAHDAIEALEDISRKVPFTVQDLTDAYIHFRNNGINPTSEEMLHFANIAAATGKSIDTVALAIQSMLTGRALGLRQFGIHATQDGENLKLVFRGQTTEIRNDAASIVKYLDDLGKNQFGTAAADQANTLGGSLIVLRSTVDRLFISTGESGLAGALVGVIKQFTAFIDKLAESDKSTGNMATGVNYLAAGCTILFATIKEVGLDVFDLFNAVIDTVTGHLEVAAGAFQAFTGDVVRGSVQMKIGLEDIASAGKKIEGIGTRANETTDIIDAAKARLTLQVEQTAATTDPKVRAFLGMDKKGGLPAGKDPTTVIRDALAAAAAEKVLDLQRQLLADLVKEGDEREKIAGITNKEIAASQQRLALVREEQQVVAAQEALLSATLENGRLSDAGRATAVKKLDGVVKQSKALQDEAKRLLDMIYYKSNAVKGNANNLPGSGGGLNAGVDAANAPAQSLGIMGHFGGASPDEISLSRADQIPNTLDLATAAVNRYGQAWTNAFQAIGAGKNVLKELEKAVGQTLAAIAQKEAEEQVAKGIADLAEGTWPPNPAAFAAAAKHFAAALLFEALAGTAGSIGGNGSGGGSGSSASSTGDTGLRTYESPQDRLEMAKQHTIQITVNAFDKNNPIDQQMLGDALQPHIERYGNKYIIGNR